MKQKQLYEAPQAQAFQVQTEGMICTSDPLSILAADSMQGFEESAIIDDAASSLWW